MDSAGSDQRGGGFGGDTPAAALADLASALDRVSALSNGDLWDHETRDLTSGLEVAARHICRLSGREAARRERQARALGALTLVADAYRSGTIGTEQVDLVALVYKNPRVREALVGFQPDLLVLAAECDYPVFEQTLRRWERLVDTDGPEPKADAAHRNRHLTMFQDAESLAWKTKASLDSVEGSRVHEVLRRLADQERLLDWDKARQVYGDSASAADLERTEAQRWADALVRMAEMAASADPDAKGPGTEHVIVWSDDTYNATVHRVTCTDPACDAEAHATNQVV